jgi:hypothetical protein
MGTACSGGTTMSEAMRKAQGTMKDILREFEPSKGHFVA